MNITKLTPEQAGTIMGCSAQYIRVGLQKGVLPIGSAVNISGKRWTFNIPITKLAAYLEITPEEIERTLKNGKTDNSSYY